MALRGSAYASFDKPKGAKFRFAPIKQIQAGLLDIGYYEAGPSDGPSGAAAAWIPVLNR
jgi:hypothetical protein